MGCCSGVSRHRASPTTSSVMLRRLRRLRVSAIFYTCGGLCAILLLVNFNEDVKRLLQQSSTSGGPHLSPSGPAAGSLQLQTSPLHLAQYAAFTHRKFPQDKPHHQFLGEDGAVPQNSVDENVISLNAKVRKRNPPNKEGGIAGDSSSSDSPLFETGEDKPWYMWSGTRFPSLSSGVLSTSVDEARLWYEDNLNNDRILEQLMFWIDDPVNNPNATLWYDSSSSSDTTLSTSNPTVEKSNSNTGRGGGGSSSSSLNRLVKTTAEDDDILANVAISTGSVQITSGSMKTVGSNETSFGGRFPGEQRRGKLKTILLYYGLGMSWGSHITSGRSVFLQQKCPVNSCRLTGNRAHLAKADIVLFKDVFMNPKVKRNPHQLWIMYMLECPLNTQNFVDKNVFNLTATYRHDSDIVTPYEKWVYYDENVKTLQQGEFFFYFCILLVLIKGWRENCAQTLTNTHSTDALE